jgi:hypothetical protein
MGGLYPGGGAALTPGYCRSAFQAESCVESRSWERARCAGDKPLQAESLPDNSRWHRHRMGWASYTPTLKGSHVSRPCVRPLQGRVKRGGIPIRGRRCARPKGTVDDPCGVGRTIACLVRTLHVVTITCARRGGTVQRSLAVGFSTGAEMN